MKLAELQLGLIEIMCVRSCVCIGNLLIALILRHMHGHARLVSAALQCCFLLSLPALSLSLSLLLFLYLFLPSIHSEYSCAAVNGFIEFAAGCCCSCCLAMPHLASLRYIHIFLLLLLLLVAYCITHQECVCMCACKRVRASVDKTQKSYTC